jgi:L-glutamine:scyllo-inosose aminotransferase/L-glutamine:2-deoxy-scyllo-inosose/3-amino-2,3-dideoxy-scyllo-inosose aminotransferase
MQQTKVLTCGEGGAAITDDARLYDLLQQLRADGRRYRNDAVAPGMMELEEIGAIQGRNSCLSEFHAAILLDRLRHLDAENARRARNAACLTVMLEQVGGITAQGCNPEVDRRTYYHYCVRVDRQEFSGASIDCIAAALTAELGILIEPVDDPLNQNVLYRPLLSGRTPKDDGFRKRVDPRQYELPVACAARDSCITFPHRILLGTDDELSDVAEAFAKVKRQACLLGVKRES